MADTLSPEERSKRMSLIRGKDTKPELKIRRLIHSLGYRYRLHSSELPGKPDLVFKGKKKAIFIHGCFWHRHDNCALARLPKSRLGFWNPKLEGNKERDKQNQEKLIALGWSFLVIWECEINNLELLTDRITKFLDKGRK
jgi:DNA mismatch endonuclease (patch repair protein)